MLKKSFMLVLVRNRLKVSFPRKRESKKSIESMTLDYPVKPDNDKKVFCASAMLYFLAAFAVCVYPDTVSLEELLRNSREFDKNIVEIEAEAIGEPLKDDNGDYWINVTQNGYHIGIYFSNPSLIEKVNHFGSYSRKGDTIRVKGVFYKDCPLHHETDVHAENLEIAKQGYILKDIPPEKKKLSSFILSVICLALVCMYFIKRRYEQRN